MPDSDARRDGVVLAQFFDEPGTPLVHAHLEDTSGHARSWSVGGERYLPLRAAARTPGTPPG